MKLSPTLTNQSVSRYLRKKWVAWWYCVILWKLDSENLMGTDSGQTCHWSSGRRRRGPLMWGWWRRTWSTPRPSSASGTARPARGSCRPRAARPRRCPRQSTQCGLAWRAAEAWTQGQQQDMSGSGGGQVSIHHYLYYNLWGPDQIILCRDSRVGSLLSLFVTLQLIFCDVLAYFSTFRRQIFCCCPLL